MFEITVARQFAAAHQLRELGGKCEKLHGHNWKVEVTVSGEELNDAGLLINFEDVKESTDRILEELDHSFLNDLPHFRDQNPSSEGIAAYIFEKLSSTLNSNQIKVTKVTAWESDSARASYLG